MTSYDSTHDTAMHVAKVQDNLRAIAHELGRRGLVHDLSKFASPEKDVFDVVTPRLAGLTYGSDEYRASLAEMKPALDHHYANNSHHPEHYSDGIGGMSLLDIVEMLCDWRAAVQRHDDGDLGDSLRINKTRFGMSDQLAAIFENTRKELGW